MKRTITLITLLVCVWQYSSAQDLTLPTTPVPTIAEGHAWEIGIHGGHLFTAGNINFIPGYAAGLHVRRSLDYVFSLRLDLNYGQPKGEDDGNTRSFEGTWMSGSIQAIAALNNLKWNLGERKTNLYAIGGIGLNSFEAEVIENDLTNPKIESDVATHVDLGAGIAFKISDKVNIGIEHKATMVLGSRADLLDGINTLSIPDERSAFRDILNYTAARINFNLIGKSAKSEPLYWLNPMDAVLADVQRLKDTRVTLTDSDLDGVIDMMDEEENTPEGAQVNSKGVTLDSDGDGIANHEDKEPYSPSGHDVNAEGVAQVPDIMAKAEALIDQKLKDFQPKTEAPSTPQASAAAWFLPSIHFLPNATKVSFEDFGTLANIAGVMTSNPNLKFVITGHTDDSGSADYNNALSYNRALSVINHLVENNKVDRNQLILNWKGEAENLVAGTYKVNRRVSFKVATNETEMTAPGNTGGNE